MKITRTKKFIATASIGAGLLAGSLGVATMAPGVANAATPTTNSAAATTTANHPKLHRLRHHELKVAADTIGMSPQQLRTELKSGQSIAQVAGDKTPAVITAVNNDVNARVDQALTNGKLTQDKADKIKAKAPEAITRIVNHVFK